MVGRRTAVGLSLLCALLFSALAVESASATETAKNTTAFTCVSKASGGFADAHCDETASPGTFGHEVIPLNTETELEITNAGTKNKTSEATPVLLEGILDGVEFSIECTSVLNAVSPKNYIKNIEPSSKVHDVEGTVSLGFSGCLVKKPANCTVSSPLIFQAKLKGVESVGAAKRMGLEFSQDTNEKGESQPFVSAELEGASCALKGTKLQMFGSFIATGTPSNVPSTKHSGATVVASALEEMQKLTVGGKVAIFTATFTASMKSKGNPISLTTVT